MKSCNILILGSPCAISDSYLDRVREIADSIGLSFTIRKTEDEEEIDSYGIEIGCLLGYCPGCHALTRENPGVKQTPAMVVEGELVFHGGYPGDELIKGLLTKYKVKN